MENILKKININTTSYQYHSDKNLNKHYNRIKKLYSLNSIDVFDNFKGGFNAQNPSIEYISAPLNKTEQEVLAIFKKTEYNEITDISNPVFRGFFFNCTDDSFSGIVFWLNEKYLTLDQQLFNNSLENTITYELLNISKEKNLPKLENLNVPVYVIIFNIINYIIGKHVGLNYEEIKHIKYLNSHKENIRYYKMCKEDIHTYVDNTIYWFSRIYFFEFKILSSLMQNKKISIHDTGSCSAIFPLSLSRLASTELKNVTVKKIMVSDINIDASSPAKKIINDNTSLYRPIEFFKLDLLSNLKDVPHADVIVSNHVLEHFEEDVSFKILQKLWEITDKLLIVNVPFEEEPNIAFGHYVSFNSKKLKQWGSKLKNGMNVTDNFKESDNKPLSEYGYLIMKKQ